MSMAFLPCTRPTIDPETFFPTNPDQLAVAKSLCDTCPCRVRCLADALSTDTTDGVWGGVLLERGEIVTAKRRPGRPRRSQSVAA